MDPASILTAVDYEKERSPEELRAWIDSISGKFSANDKTKKYARLGKGYSKQFFEEVMPLGHLASHKYIGIDGLFLRPKLGNQNYDAEIIDRSSATAKVTRVEFGNAYRDYDLALRLEYLGQHGDVPMTGPVWREGTKTSGSPVQVQLECDDHANLLRKQLSAMDKTISKKLSMAYEPGTILAIVLDDHLAFNLDKDLLQLEGFLCEKVLARVLAKFPCLFVVGASGKTFLEFGDRMR